MWLMESEIWRPTSNCGNSHCSTNSAPAPTLPPESAALVRSHDICHVIFGLDPSLADEAMADTRTLLSTDVGWKKYSTYFNDPLAQDVFKELGLWRTIVVTVRTLPRILRA